METNTNTPTKATLEALSEVFAWYKPNEVVDTLLQATNIFANLNEDTYTVALTMQIYLYRTIETHVKEIEAKNFIDCTTFPEQTITALQSVFLTNTPAEVTDYFISMISYLAEDANNSVDDADRITALRIIEIFSKLIIVSRSEELD
jgi:hypothetical protein